MNPFGFDGSSLAGNAQGFLSCAPALSARTHWDHGRSSDNYDPSGDPYAVTVPEGMTARAALGAAMRKNYAEQAGYSLDHATDSELIDALVYNVFPNFAPWGGYMPNIVYRWQTGKTPDTCIMEVRILSRVKKGEPIPRGVPRNFCGSIRNGPKRRNLAG